VVVTPVEVFCGEVAVVSVAEVSVCVAEVVVCAESGRTSRSIAGIIVVVA
jgi:hypothetical protein